MKDCPDHLAGFSLVVYEEPLEVPQRAARWGLVVWESDGRFPGSVINGSELFALFGQAQLAPRG